MLLGPSCTLESLGKINKRSAWVTEERLGVAGTLSSGSSPGGSSVRPGRRAGALGL